VRASINARSETRWKSKILKPLEVSTAVYRDVQKSGVGTLTITF